MNDTAVEVARNHEKSGEFEVVLPVERFVRQMDCFPESPVGHELFDCWVLTIEEDVGLEILGVEFLKEESTCNHSPNQK